MQSEELTQNLDKIHTTEMGTQRIKRNMDLTLDDPVQWCKQKIAQADYIVRKGKNWYGHAGDALIAQVSHLIKVSEI